VAPAGQPTIIIVSARPATTGERCSTPCTYIGRKVVAPIRIMPDSSVAALDAAIGRRLQSAKEIIGSAVRRSCSTNSSRHSRKAPLASDALATSSLPAQVSAIMSAAIAAMKSAAPPKSIEGRACRSDSRRNAMKPAADARPIGTFIQKI
jgi:hypothetical protein